MRRVPVSLSRATGFTRLFGNSRTCTGWLAAGHGFPRGGRGRVLDSVSLLAPPVGAFDQRRTLSTAGEHPGEQQDLA